MQSPRESTAGAWVAFGGALLLLVSPARLLWTRPALGWLAPYLVWFALIVLGAWLSARSPR